MDLQVAEHPGYAFGNLSFGTGSNTTEWLVGYAPHLRQNQFIVIEKRNHQEVGRANNQAGIESLLRAEISEINEAQLVAIIEDVDTQDDKEIFVNEEDLDQDGVADLTIEDAVQPAPRSRKIISHSPEIAPADNFENLVRNHLRRDGFGIAMYPARGGKMSLFGIETFQVELTDNAYSHHAFLVQTNGKRYRLPQAVIDGKSKWLSKQEFLDEIDSRLT